ncbi:MAG: histidine-type phosphatase [Betaproteobacteria bacterium]|nr:histidine-type phosphatase [Betaproteobacteria bacterium]
MRGRGPFRAALAAGFAAVGLVAAAADVAAPASEGLKLERVVMVMRHGVRPPTKPNPTPEGTSAEPWSTWTTPFGDLTPHGAAGATLMGRYARGDFARRGLLPADGCPANAVSVRASGKSRAIETAKSFVEGLAPRCAIKVDHPVREEDDVVFHPLGRGQKLDPAVARQAALRQAPAGGLDAERRAHQAEFATLQRVLRCCAPSACPRGAAGCAIGDFESELKADGEGKPALEGALGMASTAAQTLLLEYVEGKPMAEVGWGRANKADIQALLRFHATKFRYEVRSPYVAERYAAPLARRVVDTLTAAGPARLTLLVGHDTNLAALGGYLDLHWTPADYPPDSLPPGGALGFERLSGPTGKTYVRAFFIAQTLDQLRNLTPLDAANAPVRVEVPIPGCGQREPATPCEIASFERLVRNKLAHPAGS